MVGDMEAGLVDGFDHDPRLARANSCSCRLQFSP